MILLRLPFAMLVLLYQSAFLAIGQIWTNKVRSILTTVGIVIGVASVTAVISVLTGLKDSVLNQFESFGTNKIFIAPDWRGAGAQVPWERIRFRDEQFQGLLDQCPSVAQLTRMSGLWGMSISYGRKTEPSVQVMGIDPSWHKLENRNIVLGRPFSLVDVEHARPVCLINGRAKEKLDLPADCVGQSILMGKTRLLVVGVVETKVNSEMFGGEGNGVEVYLPFSTVMRMNPYNDFWVIAASRSPELSADAVAEVTFFLRRTRHIRPGEPDTFRIETMQKYLDDFKQVATTVTMAATGVVGISLLVGGVGIMNIMLVSVSERTREIGLRKAVGARPSAILLQFLVEAVMLCLFGGLLGVLGGQGLTMIARSIPAANLGKAYIPGWALALSFGFAGGVGLIFGMFPAIKAARLDPIDALRHE